MSSSDRPPVASRGPTPRRDAERRRRNKPETGAETTSLDATALAGLPFEVDLSPEPPDIENLWEDEEHPSEDTWHPLVMMVWNDMQADPARKWMTSGDWAALALFCESLSRELRPQVVGVTKEGEVIKQATPVKGATLSAFIKLLGDLGVTESGRLRLRKEVSLFPQEAPKLADVTDIASAREADVQ